jgi:hypothetical protein
MPMPKFSIVHATNRPYGWQAVYAQYLRTADDKKCFDYVLVIDGDMSREMDAATKAFCKANRSVIINDHVIETLFVIGGPQILRVDGLPSVGAIGCVNNREFRHGHHAATSAAGRSSNLKIPESFTHPVKSHGPE